MDRNYVMDLKPKKIVKVDKKFSRKRPIKEPTSPFHGSIHRLNLTSSKVVKRHFDNSGLPIVKSLNPNKSYVSKKCKLNFDDEEPALKSSSNCSETRIESPYFKKSDSKADSSSLSHIFNFKESILNEEKSILKEDPIIDSQDENECNSSENVLNKSQDAKNRGDTVDNGEPSKKTSHTEHDGSEFNLFQEDILKTRESQGTSLCPVNIDSDSDDDDDLKPFVPTRTSSLRKRRIHEDKVLCVFPKDASDAITIYESDLVRLEPETQLNDSIIDFYLRYVIFLNFALLN